MSFGKRLTQLRKREKMSREDLGNKLGISYSTVAKYETGQREPDFDKLQAISSLFDVTMDYLLNEEYPPKLSNVELLVREASDQGIDIGFYNIKDWELLTEEDVEDMRKHIEFLVAKRRQMQNGDD
ncbi:helix-turn-helix transcriptional regulator [Paenalkalicoccus suaedae]|uniref:Helix-turn-helix transcriptional regulator n=1 Tax=Paenalkalicoccus suaedae TaxID=2592382 RepID=A0A859FHM7_9BACI|nr:helix-turn-helix transcriptional regulator [Paenalkalicoccus suaedae]QKS71696.1 helix-turn-helix transcriptional regulator [Paenalkalicoccus suaedae]QKS71750.1 helix-turn-helix transcriptional regulator [Paenalkalicoccus suaedae]